MKFAHQFCVECDNKCQEELLTLIPTDQETHIFGNIMDFTPNNLREVAGLNRKTALAPAVLRKLLTPARCKITAWCVRHGCLCRAEPADIHSAGGSIS